MKKIEITSSTTLSEMIDVTQEDSPNYPLLTFTGFGVRVPIARSLPQVQTIHEKLKVQKET